MNPRWWCASFGMHTCAFPSKIIVIQTVFSLSLKGDASFRINFLNYPDISTIILNLLHSTFSFHHLEGPATSFTHTFTWISYTSRALQTHRALDRALLCLPPLLMALFPSLISPATLLLTPRHPRSLSLWRHPPC